MFSALVFGLIFILPLLIYFINSGVASKERRGIAAGIPKPKQPRAARAPRTRPPRTARVHPRRTEYCGRGFTHFALALFGSQDACRRCRFLESVPTALPEQGSDGDESDPHEPVPLVRPGNE